VPRTGFYVKRNRDGSERRGPYQHLTEEFEQRLRALQDAGAVPDPRDGQITRLKQDNANLRERVSAREAEIAELKKYRQRALSQITAQDAELRRLRRQLEGGTVMRLPAQRDAPFGSCS
jgi:chromosome segregation ATPase